MLKTITEETKEACALCRGSGQEYSSQTASGTQACRQCQGARYLITKICTIREEVDGNALADAVADRLAQRLKARPFVDTFPFKDGYFK